MLFCFVFALRSSNFYFQAVGSMQGLSQPSAVSIWQDRLGRMWFGNDALNCFDGERTRIYRMSEHLEGVEDANIHALCGNDSVLYCLAEDQLIRLDLHTETISLPGIRTAAICSTDSGLYYVDESVLHLYREGSGRSTVVLPLSESLLSVRSLLAVSPHRLLIGTAAGVYTVDRKEQKVVLEELQNENVTVLHQDKLGNVWAACQSKALYVSRRGGPFTPVKICDPTGSEVSTGDLYCMAHDWQNTLWIGTLNGAYQLSESEENPASLVRREHIFPESTVFSLFSDQQGLLWVGSYYGDVYYFNPRINNYEFYGADEQVPFRLHGAVQGDIAEDAQGVFYIATEGSGMNVLRPGREEIEHLTVENGKIPHNKIRSLWFDREYDRLYMGPYMKGLYYRDMRSGTTRPVEAKVMDSPYAKIVEKMIPYKNYLILLTQEGLFKMDRKTQEVSALFEEENLKTLCDGIIRTIYVDSRDVLWVSSYKKGLFTVDLKHRRPLNFYGDGLTKASTIPSAIVDMCGDVRQGLFLATLKSGVLNYQFDTDTFVCFSEKNAYLLSDICYNIAFSREGKLVVTSNKGVSLLDLSPKKTVLSVQHFQLNSSFPLKGLSGDCGLYTSPADGRIYIGGLFGLLVLPEEEISFAGNRYPVYFSSLWVNNERVQAGDRLLPQTLPAIKELVLPHDQNTITLSFASSDYVTHSPVLYEYKLDGWDKIWTKTEHKTITYNSLRPGKYKLTVREAQNPYREAELVCIVQPPFWKAWPALICYIIIGSWLIWKAVRFQQSKTILQTTLEMERREVARVEESNQNKLEFYTNISNEFRTPLTLIVNQLDRLYVDLPPSAKNKADKIRKQTDRLQNLITELLDFRKMEQKQLRLQVKDYELTEFLKDLYETYTEYAAGKKIHYKLATVGAPLTLWFDKRQMQKVFYNLLSFVFNYAQEGDEVQVFCGRKNTSVEIQISTTGKIKNEALWEEISNLVNSDSSGEWTSQPDGGIGLAFSQGIVRLHGGSMRVARKGGFIRFTLQLLPGKSHFSESDLMEASKEVFVLSSQASSREVSPEAGIASSDHAVSPSADLPEETVPGTAAKEYSAALFDPLSAFSPSAFSPPSKPLPQASDLPEGPALPTEPAEEAHSEEAARRNYRMLLAGNNDELCALLKDAFSVVYQVYTVQDGASAYAYALKEQPDIILSEVNMPELSGIEMCNMLKSNVNTLHIPVILITAHPSAGQEMESIRSGASDYIVAPFDMEKLFLRCNSLVKNQKKIRFKYTKEVDADKGEMATNVADLEFLTSANAILEANWEKADFDIGTWGKELGIGRTRLFNKIKVITGLTPNEYILQLKMKKSLVLLSGDDSLTIAEIAYRLGFSNPAYFSKCFKKQFGMTPQEYRKN